jgi:hypothetical protein
MNKKYDNNNIIIASRAYFLQKPGAKDQDGHLAELELGQAARRSRLATRSRLSEISRRTRFCQTAGCC